MGRDPDRESTWQVTATASPLPKGSRVIVFGDGLLQEHALPEQGRLVIGRSSEADVRIEHRSVSRKHAVIDVGPPLRVEDLGSQNGTRVRGMRLPSSSTSIVGIGDPIAIGSVVIVVQAALASATEADRDADERFVREEFLIEKVFASAKGSAPPRPVVALHVAGAIPLDLRDHAVTSSLTSAAVACRRGPRDYALALLQGDDGELDTILKGIEAAVAALGGSARHARVVEARALATTQRSLLDAATESTDADAEQRALLATNLASALLAHERHEEANAAVDRALDALGKTRTTTAAMCLALLAAGAEEHARPDLAKNLYSRAIAIETALGHERSREMLALRLSALEGARPPPSPRSLVVDKKRRTFNAGGAEEVSLARRRTLWALFEMLCDARASHPGRSVSRDDLLARAWPGERMLPDAAQNRLYVAIAELRRFGLREVLLHRDEGYAIDDAIHLELT